MIKMNNNPQYKPLTEGLEYKDMVGILKPTMHVDEFSSKMGDDDDVIVVSFFVSRRWKQWIKVCSDDRCQFVSRENAYFVTTRFSFFPDPVATTFYVTVSNRFSSVWLKSMFSSIADNNNITFLYIKYLLEVDLMSPCAIRLNIIPIGNYH